MTLDPLKFVIQEEAAPKTRIRVFGVGGGGCNAVARMLNEGLSGVEFCVLNTDVAVAVSPLTSADALICASATPAAEGALSPGTAPKFGRVCAGKRTGDERSGPGMEICRNSMFCPEPVSTVRRFDGLIDWVRTMCGTTRKTSSVSMIW